MLQILFSLCQFHELGLVHGNLSLRNILLTQNNHVFITDVALFKPNFYLDQDLDEITLFNPNINKECFFAPEIFISEGETKIIDYVESKKEKEIIQKNDVFSVACIFYSILTKGKVLFNHIKLKEYVEQNEMHLSDCDY